MHLRLRFLPLSIGLLHVVPALAQEIKPALALRTTTGATRFHVGERISLTLTLTGPDNGTYSIDTAGYDRSGRLDIDTFDATPKEGWSDPLAVYFSQGMIDGGGLRGSEVLSQTPCSFLADLNEHLRFDQPGTYNIVATSHRVGTTGKDGHFPRAPFLAIRSNPIEIQILPATPEWQAEKLRTILATLAMPLKPDRFATLPKERIDAIADLRFLNSPASIDLLAADLREDPGAEADQLKWAAALGLAGVPDSLRETTLHAMSRQLEDPAFPVSSFFLIVMAGLEPSPHDAKWEFLPADRPGFRTAWQIALDDLPRKQGSALAVTADTLLDNTPRGEDPQVTARIAAVVADSFTVLPLDRQIGDLKYHWNELNRQSIVPVLQALLRQAPSEPSTPFDTPGDLTGLVLKRWFQLDPEGAVREVPILLAAPGTPLSPAAIQSLPGGPQPQFEAAWAHELLESKEQTRQTVLAALLVRFGTGSATGEVEQKVDALAGNGECTPQAAALAYLVKFNSEHVGTLLDRALTNPHSLSCPASFFSLVSGFAHGPALDQAAITALNASDTAVAADAAQYLRHFGTASAKAPVLQRYREWSETEQRAARLTPDEQSFNATLGEQLGETLIAGQGWIPDPALTAEVIGRCRGEEMCRQLRALADAARSPTLHVNVNHNPNEEHFSVGPYATDSKELFEAKLDQFPRGSRFILTPIWKNGDEDKLQHDTEAIFARHGMILEVAAEHTPSALP